MRTQYVAYAMHGYDHRSEPAPMCWTGYTDRAKFVLHIGSKAFLFGRHDGKTLVMEILTSGFMFRIKRLQTT